MQDNDIKPLKIKNAIFDKLILSFFKDEEIEQSVYVSKLRFRSIKRIFDDFYENKNVFNPIPPYLEIFSKKCVNNFRVEISGYSEPNIIFIRCKSHGVIYMDNLKYKFVG